MNTPRIDEQDRLGSSDMGASQATGLGSAEAPEPSGLGPTGAIPSAGFVRGPWYIVTNKWDEHVVVTADGETVVLLDDGESPWDYEGYTANARLIASAPKLLHALSRIADETDTVADFDGYYLRDVAQKALAELGYDYAEIAQLSMARQDHGEHGSQAEDAPQARAPENATGAEQGQGSRASDAASANAPSVEGSAKSDEAERLLLGEVGYHVAQLGTYIAQYSATEKQLATARYHARKIAEIVAAREQELALALGAFELEYLPSGIRETPEWQAVVRAASVDTHPKDGDAQQAPLVSGAVRDSGDAQ